jgi:hypothetical protein
LYHKTGVFVLGFAAHTYGATFLSPPESCAKRSAEIFILPSVLAKDKVFVSYFGKSLAPLKHDIVS